MTKTAGVASHQTYCAVVIGDAMLPCLIIRLKGLSMPYQSVIHRSNHSLMLHGLHCGPGTLLAFPCFGLSAREPSITGIGPPGLNGSKPHRDTDDAEKQIQAPCTGNKLKHARPKPQSRMRLKRAPTQCLFVFCW